MSITIVEEALENQGEEIQFEELENEANSPLNQPVLEKEVGHSSIVENVIEPGLTEQEQAANPNEQDEQKISEQQQKKPTPAPLDAPEQEIAENYDYNQVEEEQQEEGLELPTGHATAAADTFLGIANNVLEVGSGFFVKIKKHKEFYDFDEIIQVIDEQNQKNVKRIKLDEEDKILLRPILIAILKKKAKQLTPEQQLIGAALSILMKKVQVVFEIKKENELLTAKILDIIRQEKGQAVEQEQEDQTSEENQETDLSEKTEVEFDSTGQAIQPEDALEVSEEISLK